MNDPLVIDQVEALDLLPSRAFGAMFSHRKGVVGPSFHLSSLNSPPCLVALGCSCKKVF